MNVKYLGTRMNRRDARGRESGRRYKYSSGQPNFTIDERDAIQFRGELEDGGPKFCVGTVAPPAIDTDDVPAHLVAISKLSIKQLTMSLGRMEPDELMALRDIEVTDSNRPGAIKAIDKAIG